MPKRHTQERSQYYAAKLHLIYFPKTCVLHFDQVCLQKCDILVFLQMQKCIKINSIILFIIYSISLPFSLCLCAALCVLPAVRADADDASLLGGWQDVWLFRLFLNVLGYATIIIPGYFLISYFKRINYLETGLLEFLTFVSFPDPNVV